MFTLPVTAGHVAGKRERGVGIVALILCQVLKSPQAAERFENDADGSLGGGQACLIS